MQKRSSSFKIMDEHGEEASHTSSLKYIKAIAIFASIILTVIIITVVLRLVTHGAI